MGKDRRPRYDSREFAGLLDIAGSRVRASIQASVEIQHHATAGAVRETGLGDYLRTLLSDRYFVGTGFAFDARDQLSRQLDLVIAKQPPFVGVFDSGPLVKLPCELVLAVVEVKHRLDAAEVRNCLTNASSIRTLRPFGTQLFGPARSGGQPAKKGEHRCYYSVVSTTSDLVQTSWPQNEWDRIKTTCAAMNADVGLIDRVLVLDRGLLALPKRQAFDGSDPSIANWFVHLSNHLDREAARRPPLDIDIYRNASSQGNSFVTLT